MTATFSIDRAGESAVIAYFGTSSSPEVSAAIHAVAQQVRRELGGELVDLIPSYASLLVVYDPLQTDHHRVGDVLRTAANNSVTSSSTAGKLVTLPAYYGEDSGPDLGSLAATAGLSVEEVIRLHTGMEYRVYAIGFAPGFAYLGEVDERIAAPRLATPRLKVPRGAIAIADRQTAVYPATSPGGWNLIGMCPVAMFDPDGNPPMPVNVGDSVRFEAIDRGTFLELGGELITDAVAGS